MHVASEDQDDSLAVWLWARHAPSLGLCVLIHKSSSLDWRGRNKIRSGQLLTNCGLCPSGPPSPHRKMGTTKVLPGLLGQQCFWTLTCIRVTQDLDKMKVLME